MTHRARSLAFAAALWLCFVVIQVHTSVVANAHRHRTGHVSSP